MVEGELTVGQVAHLAIDEERRTNLRANHSATHLLHKVLRDNLGAHVVQKGSLVAADRLRFDFSHQKAISPEALQLIEREVNQQIRRNTPVNVRVMTPEAATKEGAMALFGEKYGDEVRVVSMGGAEKEPFSIELCGGTHVTRTGDIGFFKILSESGIAAGIRRIEAVTGEAAEEFSRDQSQLVSAAADVLKVTPPALLEKIRHLSDERKALDKEVQSLRQRLATAGSGETLKPEMIGDVPLYKRHVKGLNPQDLKPLVDELKTSFKSGIFVVANEDDGKVSVVIGVSADLISRFNAVDLIRAAVPSIGGKGGGGRPDLAQAGGADAGGIPALFEEIGKALL